MRTIVCIAAIAAITGVVCACGSSETGAMQATATPVFSPEPGTYTGAQEVTITCATPGATIYYTNNGAAPTTASPVYTRPISVSSKTRLMALALAPGYSPSVIADGTYTIELAGRAPMPTFSPPEGNYGAPQTVTIACTAPGATIQYTVMPNDEWIPYTGPIAVTAPFTWFSAVCSAPGFNVSEVAGSWYGIDLPQSPTFVPSPGTYWTAQSVALLCTTPDVRMYYTTDDTTPDDRSNLYVGPISVTSKTTIKAVAINAAGGASPVAIGTYEIGSSEPCTEEDVRACFTGPSSARNVGLCHDGSQRCINGQWEACGLEQLPVAELCNGQDDDCDGIPDNPGSFGVRDANPVCSATVSTLPPLSGDSGVQTSTVTGYSEGWFAQTFTENSGAIRDLSGAITLYAPYGCVFDLFVYCDACGGRFFASTRSGWFDPVVVNVRELDHEGTDDAFTVIIEVRYVSCAPGMNGGEVCGPWKVVISANTGAPGSAPSCH